MLSYRHAFHAGNHADVLKHVVLVNALEYLGRKAPGFWCIDTHAGAGSYRLDPAPERGQPEFADGIARLLAAPEPPEAVARYLRQVVPAGTELLDYPGSPLLAANLLRDQDRLLCYELHPADAEKLRHCIARASLTARVEQGDGFAGLKAALPPPTRRGLVLMDPSYEVKSDYDRVVSALADALRRFRTGIYLLWYPQLPRRAARELPQRLLALGAGKWLHATLGVRRMAADGGLCGSGVFVVNPPWPLAGQLEAALPWLAAVLAQDAGAGYALEVHGGD